MDKTDKWGKRKLACRVQKHNEGFHVLLQFTSGPEAVKEIERRLRVADMVLKFITVRIDEKLKQIAKRKKAREKRALRKPAPPSAMPSAPSAEQIMSNASPGEPVPEPQRHVER